MKVLIYTYYSRPWKLQSGDDIRVHTIAKAMKEHLKSTVIVYNLNHLVNKTTMVKNDVVYVSIPRRAYQLTAGLLRWSQKYDLNPLMKLTHYIDEFITVTKLADTARQAKIIYVFGSMTLFSLFLRMLGKKDALIVYDPLANYAQTLYLRSRRSKIELMRYGLYLALHKLQLKRSNYFVYPSKTDLENAKRMFNIKNAVVVPNPTPIYYESVEEYKKLRAKRKDLNKPYFILLAGGKGRGNEEAVKITIEIFNELTPGTFQLYITGPWQDLRGLIKNSSIKIFGIVSTHKLKELLAVSDYGLAPIFTHGAGTFLKVLVYVAAGLHIISSPWGVQGIDTNRLRGRRVFIVRNAKEYKETISYIVSNSHSICQETSHSIFLCRDAMNINNLTELLNVLEKT